MKRRRILLIAGACAVVLMRALFWPGEQAKDPVYEGKKLSEWLHMEILAPMPEDPRARRAILEIGTNALPYLLREVSRSDSSVELELDVLLMKLPNKTVSAWAKNRIQQRPFKKIETMLGFQILGPKAEPDVPELMRIAGGSPPSDARVLAIEALAWVGPIARPAVPMLLKHFSDPHETTRYAATNAVRRIAPQMLNGGEHLEKLVSQ